MVLEVGRIVLILGSLIITSYLRHHILLKIECNFPRLFEEITNGKGDKWKGQTFKLIAPSEWKIPWRIHLLLINSNDKNIVSSVEKYTYIISFVVMLIMMADVIYRLFS